MYLLYLREKFNDWEAFKLPTITELNLSLNFINPIQSGNITNWFTPYIIPLIVGFVTILTVHYQNIQKNKDELNHLIAELYDLKRHLIANCETLGSIDLEKGLPSIIHFEKLIIPDNILLFSEETFRKINIRYARPIHELKLKIRNRNIEAKGLIQYFSKKNINKSTLNEYITYVNQGMFVIINETIKTINIVTKTNQEPLLTEIPKNSKPIFYETRY